MLQRTSGEHVTELQRSNGLATKWKNRRRQMADLAESRLDLADERSRLQPSVYVRTSGYLLLLALAAVVCYSAAL